MFYALSKGAALVVMVVATLVFVRPGVMHMLPDGASDSFPVSHFAMFSDPRPQVHAISYVRGITDSGDKRSIRAGHFSNGGMNQTLHQLSRLRHKGKKRITEYCQRIAKLIGKRRRYRDLVSLELVRGYYRPEVIFGERDDTPERERIVGRCKMEPRP